MVAVFTGTGLGLFNTSVTQLGGASGGSSGLGQLRGGQSVNLATGNLVLQELDESLLVRGLGATLLRTYNSRGTVAGQGQDGWVTGFERNVTLTGALDDAASTVSLTTGDGQTLVFTYSGTANKYVTTGGDGAHDSITWVGGTTNQWTYVEGSTRREELYADHASATLKGRLIRIRDLKSDGATPAQYDIVYDASNRISEVRSVDGSGTTADAIVFAYNGTTTQLLSISTREGGVLKSQVSYGYDAGGRLAWVQTDLTPEISNDNVWNGSVASDNDGKRFRTSYTYVSGTASDLRIAGVSTSDGVSVAYGWEADGSDGFRVKWVAQGNSGGDAQITSFTYNAGSTDVKDGAGRTWTYEYDASKQLTGVLEPAVNGLRQKTSYTYDTSGNVTRITQAPSAGGVAALDTVFRYDDNGNRILQRDQQGNTMEWTYDATTQQLKTEKRYTVADADGLDPTHAGTTNLPSGVLTTNYAYDSRARLRFVVNAAGEVTEFTYATTGNGIGQVASERRYLGATYTGAYDETTLNSWATNATALRKSNSALTTYSYDIKGRLSQSAQYASVSADVNGNGVLDAATGLTTFSYDAQGLLRQKITVHGTNRTLADAAPGGSEVTDYVYDGMGRLLSALSRDIATAAMPDPRIDAAGYAAWVTANDATTVLSTYAYVDSQNQIKLTTDTGVVRTEVRNTAGMLVSSSEVGTVSGSAVTRSTLFYYDNTGRLRASEDAAGARSYFFYDNAGRVMASVDGTGAVTQTVYDGVGRVVQRIAYATRVNTATWVSSNTVTKTELVFAANAPTLTAAQAWVQTSAANDHVAQTAYDSAGRVSTVTVVGADASQTQKTTHTYDAANRLIQTSVTDGANTSATARTTRYLYDAADRQIATIDASNYVTETVYDLAGRVVKTIRYANASGSPAATALATLRPTTHANDQSARYFYDGRGQQIGALDAEGYLTEFVYDEALNLRAVKAYAKKLTELAGSETLAALRTNATTSAPAEALRLTQRSYNGLGQLLTELNHEGTVTRYSYDEAGRLVKTESAQGTTDVREGNLRFDAFDNLIGELSGQGSTQLLANMTEPQLDALYAQYGVRHSYDLVGRRTESIDAAGNKTWYFYDAAGRQTFVAKGIHDSANLQNAQAEVTETRYDAFGQVIDSIAYTGPIRIAVPGNRASVQTAITTLSAIGATDSRVQFSYDRRGLLTQSTDAEGYRSIYIYTAFGQVAIRKDWGLDNSLRKTTTHTYDKRGLRTTLAETGGSLSRSQGTTYDAFGRALTRTDARGTVTTVSYDRLGRQIGQSTDLGGGRIEAVATTYDAYSRVVTQTDAMGKVTTYSYSDSNRTMTVTSPEGVAITTAYNRFGQTLEVRQPQPGGSTAVSRFEYDKDGQLTAQINALNQATTHTYDARQLLTTTTDASGRKVEYRYDARGRMLQRIEDPGAGKLNLTTTMVYDGQGRQIRVTDASGRVTAMAYDRKGNLIETTRDPSGLALKTSYSWDRDGRQLTVTEGAGSAIATTTAYGYDALGRRTTEIRGSGSLNLTTTYEYDANDNVTRRIDASGRVTRYSYDGANRLRFSIDGANGVTETAYDKAGRATMTRAYAKALDASTLGAAPSEAQVAGLVLAQSLANDALDAANYRLYDGDGRVRLSIDGSGGVSETVYDVAGRVARQTRYAQPVALGTTLRNSLVAGTATAANVGAVASASDQSVRSVYDAAGQLRYSIDGTGGYRAVWYDAAGRVAVTRAMTQRLNMANISDGMTATQIDGMNLWGATDDLDMFVYDSAGRLRFELQTVGDPTVFPFTAAVTERTYDGADRVLSTRAYVPLMTLDTALIAKLGGGTAVEADFAGFATAHVTNAQTTRNVYDAAGQLRYSIDGTGSYRGMWYDAAGRVVVARSMTQRLNMANIRDATTVAQIDGMNQWGATDDLDMFVYDSAGRLRFELQTVGDPTVFPFTAAVTERTYDSAGRTLSTRAYVPLMTLDTALIAKLGGGTAVVADFAAFTDANAGAVQSTRQVYDAAGRMTYQVDATGGHARMWYDAAGRMVATRKFVARLSTAGLSDATTVTQLDTLLSWSGSDEGVFNVYDAAGRLRFAYDTQGALQETTYDGVGRALSTRGFTATFSAPPMLYDKLFAGSATSADFATFTAANAATAQSQRTVYDAAGRAIYSIDALGAYTRNWYDGAGRTTAVRRFAATFNIATLSDATTSGQLDGQLAWGADYQTEFRVYDAAGRVRLVYDGLSQLSQTEYDGVGRATISRRYASAYYVDSPMYTKLFAGYATAADFAAFTAANESTARAQAWVYDAGGKTRFSLSRDGGQWLVDERRYDGLGRVTSTPRYGFGIAYTPGQTEAQVIGAIQLLLSPDPQVQATQVRATHYVYDAASQQRFVLDASGALSEQRYDGAGRVTETRRYGNLPVGVAMSVSALSSWAQTQSAADVRKVGNTYDAAGRLSARTDALNHSESFTYDGVGRMLTRTDRMNAVWSYQYDAAGRRTAEFSPASDVYAITAQGAISVANRSIVTRYVYDALGQLTRKTEDADNATVADRRVTDYVYDTRGNRIKTILPNPGAIDPVTGNLVYSGTNPTIETTFDALGQAVVQKDERGNYHYTAYDLLGRVAAEVDQECNVTTYAYNAFGEQSRLLRYAATLNTAAAAFTSVSWQPGQTIVWSQIVAGVDNGNAGNRTIETAYDGLGRKTQVTMTAVQYYNSAGVQSSGSPITQYVYNAYGDAVKESVLLEGAAGQAGAVWAHTWRYFDAAGRNTTTVDAEGHVTAMTYNATGEVVKTVEYARAIATTSLSTQTAPALPGAGDAATGYDREMRWSYDVLGRKASETAVRNVRNTDGSSAQLDTTTTYDYDFEDRVTAITDHTGTIATTYNALGQSIAVREQMRSVLVGNADILLQASSATDLASASLYQQRSPYTTIAYDGLGRLVATRRHANGHDGVNPPAISANDQVELTLYSQLDRALMNQNALGHKTWSAYDEAGNLVKTWSGLDAADSSRNTLLFRSYSYDKVGRQTSAKTTRGTHATPLANGIDQSETVTYNAFGEIASKVYEGLAGTLQYTYDAAGRMVADNVSGATRSIGYNLAGHQVRESHKTWIDATTGAVDTVTLNQTDKLGRAIAVTLPSHTTTAGATSLVRQTFDRWGNTLQVIDGRGYQTNYQYNDRNQLVRETRPLVWVVAENGAGTWQRPVNEWYYDAYGRLSGTRDANGNLRRNHYDALGRMTGSTDALNNVSRQAYDVFGQQRLMQDALGYITFKDYDVGGRVTSIGDFMAEGATRQRAVQQSYALNQHGDRIRVTNALNFTAKYDYDSQQRLLRSETAMGVTMQYAYDAQGRKVLETNGVTEAVASHTDRDNELVRLGALTWKYDVFGRLTDHNNLSGRDSDYVYDVESGMLKSESASGGVGVLDGNGQPMGDAIKTIRYTRNGRVREIVETGTGGGTYRYEYDAAGNRTLEKADATDAHGMRMHTITRSSYDSNNRVVRVTQDEVDGSGATLKRVFDLAYDYDANGNRRRVVTQSGYGPNVTGIGVVNTAPVATTPPADRTFRKGASGEFRLLFSDVFRDAEGDALTLSITQSNGTALPSWLVATRDAQTGEIVFTGTVPAGAADADVVVKLTAHETANPTRTTFTTFTVRVRSNTTPTASTATTTFNAVVGQAFGKDLTAAAYFVDPDVGEMLSLSVVGTVPSWLKVNTSQPGVASLTGTPPVAGSYVFTLRATDSQGAFLDRTITVNAAANAAPTVVAPLPQQTATATSLFQWNKPLSQVFADANSDTLQVTATGLPAWLAFQHIGGATPKLSLVGQVPSTEVNNRIYTITLTATDPSGASVSTTMEVKALQNTAPVAPVNVTVPAAIERMPYSVVLPAFTDIDGDALTYSVSQVPPGMVFDAATRTISGTPAIAGSWIISYSASDGAWLTATTFTLAVQFNTNTAPVAPSVVNQRVVQGAAANVTLPVFTDVNGDTLSYSVGNLPPGLSFNAATRTITGTAATAGSWVMTYTANDGRSGITSTRFLFSVTSAVNQAPVVVNALQDQVATHGTAFAYTVPANAFADPEGSTLTYSATWASGAALPGWLTFNAVTRTFSGTPPAYAQSGALRVRATDPQGLFTYADFELTLPETGGSGTEPLVFEMESASQTEALANTAVPVQVKDQWFTYDAENRLKVVNGMLSGAAGAANTSITLRTESLEDTAPGQIEVSDSYALMYDAAGRVVGRHQRRTVNGATQDQVALNSYDQRGNRLYEFYAQAVGGDSKGIAKQYQYDAAGQLLETRRYFALGTIKEVWVAPVDRPAGYVVEQVDASGWLMYSEQLRYDQDGRMRWQETRGRETNFRYYLGAGSGSNQYTDLGLLHFQSRVDYTLADNTTNVDDNLSSYDAAGRMVSYRYSSTGLGATNGYTHTFTTTFEGWESWQERIVAGKSTAIDYKETINTITLDAFGRINQQSERTITDQPGVFDKIRAYTYNGDGQVQTRRHGYWDGYFRQATKPDSQGNPIPQNYQNVYAAGQQMVELEAGGAARVTLPTTRNGAMVAAAFGLGQTNTLSNTNGIAGSGLYAAGGMSVTVMEGETLHRLAQRVYGTATLWYVLADANGLSDAGATLTAGTQLKAPSVSVNSNDANTFKPYNPNEAIGSTTPSLPYIPPVKEAGCNVVAMVLMIVIAIVVTYITAGAATNAILAAYGTTTAAAAGTTLGVAAAAAGGFVGGVVGSVASQAVGSALGVASFSWRQVAVDGLVTAATMGFGELVGGMATKANQAGKVAKLSKLGKLLTTVKDGQYAVSTFGRVAQGVVGYTAGVAANAIVDRDTHFSWGQVAATAFASYVGAKVNPTGSFDIFDESSSLGRGLNRFAGEFFNGGLSATARRMAGGEKQNWNSIAINAAGQAAGEGLRVGISDTLRKSQQKDVDELSESERMLYSIARRAGDRHSKAIDAAIEAADLLNNDPNLQVQLTTEDLLLGFAPASTKLNDPEHRNRIFQGGVNGALNSHLNRNLDGTHSWEFPLPAAFASIHGKSPRDGYSDFRKELLRIGITNDNATQSAAYLVLPEMSSQAIEADIVSRLGEGFSSQYKDSPAVQSALRHRIGDSAAGQMINISDFWNAAVQDTIVRAYNHDGASYFRASVNGGAKVWGISDALGALNLSATISGDNMAPKALRDYNRRSLGIDLALLFAPLPIKGAGAAKGAVASSTVLRETLLGKRLSGFAKLAKDFVNTPLWGPSHSGSRASITSQLGVLGDVDAARKAVVSRMASSGETVTQTMRRLESEGHGVQRHGPRVTPAQLRARVVEGKDPMTGTTVDGVHGGDHGYAQHATKVTSEDAFVFAENYARNSRSFADETAASTNGRAQVSFLLRDVFGDDFRQYVYGVSRYGPRNTPLGAGSTQFSDAAQLIVRYKQDSSGKWLFNSMFPNP